MERVKLGKTGLEVSRIAFGTWQLGGEWGGTDEDAAIRAIKRALDEGINFFDTAQAYGFGASERLLARALRETPRDELILATKGGLRREGNAMLRDSSGSWIRKGVDESLHELKTDYIDLYQVHWPDPATPFFETAEALAKLIESGKIRHVGVSNFSPAQITEFSKTLVVETVQPPYHLFRREIEKELLPYAAENNIGVLVYGPLAHGLLSGNLTIDTTFSPDDWRSKSTAFEGDGYAKNLEVVERLRDLAASIGTTVDRLAISWTLHHPAVHVAIIGTRSEKHVEEAVQASKLNLDAETLRKIDTILADAVPISGPSPESV